MECKLFIITIINQSSICVNKITCKQGISTVERAKQFRLRLENDRFFGSSKFKGVLANVDDVKMFKRKTTYCFQKKRRYFTDIILYVIEAIVASYYPYCCNNGTWSSMLLQKWHGINIFIATLAPVIIFGKDDTGSGYGHGIALVQHYYCNLKNILAVTLTRTNMIWVFCGIKNNDYHVFWTWRHIFTMLNLYNIFSMYLCIDESCDRQ